MFAFGSWQGTAGSQRLELSVANVGTTGYHCKELPVPRGWNSWFPTMVLLNGPVQNVWFCLLDRYRNVYVWFMARNCWFPNRLPLQGTADSQRMDSLVPTWEPEVTISSNCRFPEVGTHASQPGKHRLPLQGTAGSQRMELLVPNLGARGYHCKHLQVPRGWNSRFPTWEPQGTIARNCRSQEAGTLGSQLGTMGCHCKQLLK